MEDLTEGVGGPSLEGAYLTSIYIPVARIQSSGLTLPPGRLGKPIVLCPREKRNELSEHRAQFVLYGAKVQGNMK